MYSAQNMAEYYKREQVRAFQDQAYNRIAAEHAVQRAVNERQQTRDAFQGVNAVRPQFTAEEQRMIEQYEQEEAWRRETAARNERERLAIEAAERENAERIRLEAKRKRVIAADSDLRELRRAIDTAEASMHNKAMIDKQREELQEKRQREVEEEKKTMREAEELAEQMRRQDQERQTRIAMEAREFMLDAQRNKAARDAALREETLRQEREIVQRAVQEAIRDRDAQIQAIQRQQQRAREDYVQNVKDLEAARQREAEAQAREDALIKRYHAEQEAKSEERKKYLEVKTLAFDALLNKMAAFNREREQKLRRAEEMRVEIAEFMEEERQRSREEADRLRLTQQQAELQAAIVEARKQRAAREAAQQAEEEFYKRQAVEQFRNSQEAEKLSEQKRRMAILKMKEESEREVERMRQIREAEELRQREEEKKALGENWYDEEAQQMALEEREALLRNYAARVFDYMDKGRLRPEDVALLPEEIKQKIQEAQRDRMFLQAGVAQQDRQVVGSLPGREAVDAARKELLDKKRTFKSALPW